MDEPKVRRSRHQTHCAFFITSHTATETVDIILPAPLYFFARNISEVAAANERVLTAVW